MGRRGAGSGFCVPGFSVLHIKTYIYKDSGRKRSSDCSSTEQKQCF